MCRVKKSDNKGRVVTLRAFRNNPGASMRELAKAAGYSLTTIHYHIHQLIDDGIIERDNLPVGVYDREAKKTVTTKQKKKKISEKERSRRECERQARERIKRNKSAEGLNDRMDRIVREAKERGTYYGPEIVTVV